MKTFAYTVYFQILEAALSFFPWHTSMIEGQEFTRNLLVCDYKRWHIYPHQVIVHKKVKKN